VVDERGLPVRLALTPGQASDKAAAPGLLAGLPAASVVIADRGYDWQHLVDLVSRRGVIPARTKKGYTANYILVAVGPRRDPC
jgi:transposase